MSMKSRILATLLMGAPLGLTFAGMTAQRATAQDESAVQIFRPKENLQEAMEREFFDHEKSILRSRDLGGVAAASHLIGVPRYSENGIIEDSRSVHRLYTYLQEQQTYTAPTLRAADLVSPFNSSVQFLPTAQMASTPPMNGNNMPFIPSLASPIAPPQISPQPIEPPQISPPTNVMPMPMPAKDPAPRLPVQGKF